MARMNMALGNGNIFMKMGGLQKKMKRCCKKYIIAFSVLGIFLLVVYLVYSFPETGYDIAGNRDYKSQGGPQGRFIVEMEHPAYILYDFGPYGENKEKIQLGGDFIWTSEVYQKKFWCYGEDGMLIIDNTKLHITFIKKVWDSKSNTEWTLKKYYVPTEYTILNTPYSLSKEDRQEYKKIKYRGEQEKKNRIGRYEEKVDWTNPFQKHKLSN